MAIKTTASSDGKTVTLFVEGRFDFSLHKDFSEAYKDLPKGEKHFIVDLSQVQYMDSSAMGMLLQLREHAAKDGMDSVILANPSSGVADILRIANFEKLFTVK
jgi:HptB-dependent secretion and biofilm anti anti-sigma factor